MAILTTTEPLLWVYMIGGCLIGLCVLLLLRAALKGLKKTVVSPEEKAKEKERPVIF